MRALFDNVREFFAMRFRRIDGQLSKEAKSAAADLKQRVDMYVEQVDAVTLIGKWHGF